jgi:hypothetical protein
MRDSEVFTKIFIAFQSSRAPISKMAVSVSQESIQGGLGGQLHPPFLKNVFNLLEYFEKKYPVNMKKFQVCREPKKVEKYRPKTQANLHQ